MMERRKKPVARGFPRSRPFRVYGKGKKARVDWDSGSTDSQYERAGERWIVAIPRDPDTAQWLHVVHGLVDLHLIKPETEPRRVRVTKRMTKKATLAAEHLGLMPADMSEGEWDKRKHTVIGAELDDEGPVPPGAQELLDIAVSAHPGSARIMQQDMATSQDFHELLRRSLARVHSRSETPQGTFVVFEATPRALRLSSNAGAYAGQATVALRVPRVVPLPPRPVHVPGAVGAEAAILRAAVAAYPHAVPVVQADVATGRRIQSLVGRGMLTIISSRWCPEGFEVHVRAPDPVRAHPHQDGPPRRGVGGPHRHSPHSSSLRALIEKAGRR